MITAIPENNNQPPNRMIKSNMIEVEGLAESDITMRQRKLLLLLNYMLPPDYEFYKNDAQQLWDLFDGTTFEWPDDQFFKFTRVDHSTGMPMYKLNKNFVHHLHSYHDYAIVSELLRIYDSGTCIPNTTRHVSVPGSIASRFLENMDRIKALQTILVLREDGPGINYLPRDFFQELPFLQALDLSHTNISELPDSIGYAPQLKYLNLSYTYVVQLPNSICNIITLETLKIRGCLKLRGLPKSIRRLKYLKHFDVDVSHLLISMPAGVGDLCQLQTLPAFVVGKQDGWHISQLKNLKNLGPNLRILRLENLSSPEQAKEAALHEKNLLKKLEFHWNRPEDGLEVLESLRPSQYIEELQIVGYGGAKFPSWIGDPMFSCLASISIHNCTKSDVLPSLGKLPSLIFLHISDMNKIKAFEQQLSGTDIIDHENTPKPFAMLEQLTFSGMPELNQWVGVREGDFPCLQKLKIVDCPKLKILPKLSFFSSLQQLEISFCHSVECFPDGDLPISLQSIVIIKCPMLKEQYYNATEGNWEKLAHIPNIWIDHQKIHLEKLLVTFAKLKERHYELASLGLESPDNPNITPKSPPSSIGGAPTTTRLQLLPEPGYSHQQRPLSSVSDALKIADWDSMGQYDPQNMSVGVPAKSMDPDSFGRSVAQDVHPQVALQTDSNLRHFDEEITINQSPFSDVFSSSDMDESDRYGKVPSVPWGSGNFPYLAKTYDDSSFSYSPSLPSVLEQPSSSFFEGHDDPLPAIDGLQVSGEAFPGQEIQACGYSINGTTSCNFEWVRHLEDGSFNYIEGAKEPNYLVTADDIDTCLAIEVQPLDNRKHKGELVKVFANDQKKITCDPEMLEQIKKSLHSGHASYEVSLAAKYLDIWEPAILAIKREGYSIKRTSGAREVVVTEKFLEKTSASLHYGHPTAFSVNEHLLRTESSTSRDIIVLTMRLFIMRAVEKSKVKKKGIFFNK